MPNFVFAGPIFEVDLDHPELVSGRVGLSEQYSADLVGDAVEISSQIVLPDSQDAPPRMF